MFDIDATDIRRIALSAIGALLVSATCIVGAAGPARAAAPDVTVTVTAAPATGLVGAVRY